MLPPTVVEWRKLGVPGLYLTPTPILTPTLTLTLILTLSLSLLFLIISSPSTFTHTPWTSHENAISSSLLAPWSQASCRQRVLETEHPRTGRPLGRDPPKRAMNDVQEHLHDVVDDIVAKELRAL